MQSEQPLLTIAIPTYNRSQYLQELLNSLIPQLVDELRVELVISDNASTDATQLTVEAFRQPGLRFTYIRNENNIGADSNFIQCFERASGKYVWIIGDDDVVVHNGLTKILDCLASADYDLVYLSSYTFQGEYCAKDHEPCLLPEVLTDARAFALKVHVSMTFISGNIVNRNRVISLPHSCFRDLVGSNLAQLGWTYTALRYFRSGLYIRDPFIAGRLNNTGGYALCEVFGVTLKRVTEEWLVDTALVQTILNGTIQVFFPYYLLKLKTTSKVFHKEDAHAVLRSVFGDNFRYWFFDYPIIKLPGPLAKVWFFISKAVAKIDRIFGSFAFG